MRITNDDTQFLAMKRGDLATWYKQVVGYNPVEEDPSITLEELREDCREMALIRRCGGIDTAAYRRIETKRLRAGVVGGFYESYNEPQNAPVSIVNERPAQLALSA